MAIGGCCGSPIIRSRLVPTVILATPTAIVLLMPSTAEAATGVPDLSQCFIPEVIVGATPAAPCVVLVRDTNGVPMPDVLVELRFGPVIS
jgi:hypothetical protein